MKLATTLFLQYNAYIGFCRNNIILLNAMTEIKFFMVSVSCLLIFF